MCGIYSSKEKGDSGVHAPSEKLEEAEKGLLKEKTRIHDTLVKKRKHFLQKVNAPYKVRNGQLTTAQAFQAEIEWRNRQQALQTVPLTPELIMKEVIMRNDPSFLQKQSPLLTPQEVQEIINHVCDYYQLLVFYQLCEESLLLIDELKKNPADNDSQSKLALELDYEFLDHRAYPEIAYFKVTEGKLPRPEQAEIHKVVCEGLRLRQSRLYQHKAGGGKTDYLTP